MWTIALFSISYKTMATGTLVHWDFVEMMRANASDWSVSWKKIVQELPYRKEANTPKKLSKKLEPNKYANLICPCAVHRLQK
jgi:hypothetical protein